jgi:hypothetical protein
MRSKGGQGCVGRDEGMRELYVDLVWQMEDVGPLTLCRGTPLRAAGKQGTFV